MHHAKCMKIAAIVPTKDRLEKLQITVCRLLGGSVDHIVVFDNDSKDGTGDWLKSLKDPRLTILHSEENVGGAGGFSRSIAHCRSEIDPDWYVLMDDDARPYAEAICAFRGVNSDKYDIVASAVYHPNGDISELNRPAKNPFWSIGLAARTIVGGGRMGFHIADESYHRSEVIDIDTASFVGLFISRSVINEIGLPNEKFFIYGDDTVYTLKARRAGLRAAFIPQIQFEHDNFECAREVTIHPMWKVYYLCRNGIFVAREAAGITGFPFAFIWYLSSWIYKVRLYNKMERLIYLKLVARGVFDGLWGRLGRNDKIIVELREFEANAGSTIGRVTVTK